MHCAIIGCGLAGLSTGYFLKNKGIKLTFFDKVGLGGGASKVASGLMHPYVGKKGLRSKFATEALEVSQMLIDQAEKALGEKVALRNGIFRHNWEGEFEDVKKINGGSLIQSGITVFIDHYLQGLWKCLKSELIIDEVSLTTDFSKYDRVIFALGGGFSNLALDLPLQFVKGQILTVKSDKKWERSVIGSGHISPLRNGNYQIGSTYEHHFRDDKADIDIAKSYLEPKVKTFLPPLSTFEIIECKAGIRVAVKGSYIPLVKKINERMFIFTGLGSRGLLYHGLYGRHLANLIK